MGPGVEQDVLSVADVPELICTFIFNENVLFKDRASFDMEEI